VGANSKVASFAIFESGGTQFQMVSVTGILRQQFNRRHRLARLNALRLRKQFAFGM